MATTIKLIANYLPNLLFFRYPYSFTIHPNYNLVEIKYEFIIYFFLICLNILLLLINGIWDMEKNYSSIGK